MHFGPQRTLSPTEEQLKLLHSQLRAQFLIEDVWNVTTPLTAVALLIGALGLFMRRNWGRVLTLGVLVGMILQQTGVLVLLVWLKLEPLSSMVWPDLPVLSVPVLVAWTLLLPSVAREFSASHRGVAGQ